jgi:CHAT domain-containing protein
VLIGAKATKQALTGAGPRFRTIHIAGHGVFDAAQPLDSRLLLAPAGSDNGELRVGELYALTLSADLVTLSACETGLGRITDGGDVIGMTRGFLYAGATTVVASLWQVADEATLALMERFYANLTRMNKRDAMRAAQLEVARKIPQPYFWAAFYLTGSAG